MYKYLLCGNVFLDRNPVYVVVEIRNAVCQLILGASLKCIFDALIVPQLSQNWSEAVSKVVVVQNGKVVEEEKLEINSNVQLLVNRRSRISRRKCAKNVFFCCFPVGCISNSYATPTRLTF